MKSFSEFFSPDYFTARDRFREAAAKAGGRLEAILLDAKGPSGEDLSIDVAWFGVQNPRRVLLHSSGLHGVEGFAGSAIQLQLLNDLPNIPQDAALIVVHVLNPYGMAWLRRFNENHVDLNRNFLSIEKPDPKTVSLFEDAFASYSRFNSFLNPQSPPASDFYFFRAFGLMLQHGMPMLKQAVVGGQYWFPKGLFFGGKLLSVGSIMTQLQQGPEKYQTFLAQRLPSAERIVAVDVHTGLGKYGSDSLLVEEENYEALRDLFGNRVEPANAEKGVAFRIWGAHHSMIPRLVPKAAVFFVTQEFGTYNGMRVLHALREENRWHHYGAGTLAHPSKRILKETFYPQDGAWQQSILKRGGELLKQALSNL